NRIAPVRLERYRRGDAHGVGTSLHLGKFKFAGGVGIYSRSHATRFDELDAYAFGRIAAINPHDSRRAPSETILHLPLVRLGPIPGVRRGGFAFDAAFSRVKITLQIRDIRIRQTHAECRHAWA